MKNPELYNCINSYTTKKNGDGRDLNIYDGKNPGFAVQSFLSSYPRNDKSGGRQHVLFIDRIDLTGNKEGVLGNANIPKKKLGMYDFEINLNVRNFSNYPSPNVWAGVILHEMLHNVGYDHPAIVNKNFAPNDGNFVYETGYCTNGEGTKSIYLNGDEQLFVD